MQAWKDAGYAVTAAKPAAPAKPVGPPSAQTLYGRHFATCHQPDGKGMAGHYPPLAGNSLATMADPRALVLVTLHGLGQPQASGTPAGSPPPAQMPGFAAQLNDKELADIATYVRASWGNRAGAVTPAQVKAMRARP
jgi:mono/diheme cytochrome c family protein